MYKFNGSKLRKPDWSSGREPTVLVSCGSFSPVTYLHLRLFEMARDELEQQHNVDVLGGFASPVADAYGKKGLVPAGHRVAMVERALESSEWVACDSYEASLDHWTKTRPSLEHFQEQVDRHCGKGPDNQRVRIRLICGTGSLASRWSHHALLTNYSKKTCLIR